MSYYENIYKKRLGRYGDTAGERLEKGRQRNFERFLMSSPHYVTFFHKKGEYGAIRRDRGCTRAISTGEIQNPHALIDKSRGLLQYR